MGVTVICDQCGTPITKRKSHVKEHNFCSPECWAQWQRENKTNPKLAEMNRNRTGSHHSEDTRESMRIAKLLRHAPNSSGSSTGYNKMYGKSTHRYVAEQMLGRPLTSEEIVHHIDGNKQNNRPENLFVFSSRAAHSRFHMLHRGDSFKGLIPTEDER